MNIKPVGMVNDGVNQFLKSFCYKWGFLCFVFFLEYKVQNCLQTIEPTVSYINVTHSTQRVCLTISKNNFIFLFVDFMFT